MTEQPPPLDRLLDELGLEVIDASGTPRDPAMTRDVMLEAMEIPKRIYARMLRANFDYPFVKFAMTDDGRPMLMTELPTRALDRDELGRGLVRLTVVADRLLEETAHAVADRGILPDWSDRVSRNASLTDAYRAEVESAMPLWEPPVPKVRRPGILARLLGRAR